MLRSKADLHTHTTCSDGKLSPVELVQFAHDKKLSVLSITDHDTFDGYFKAKDKAEELGIELVPGVEISASYKEKESHILAYYFDPDDVSFSNFLGQQKKLRRDRIRGIISTIGKKGISVDYDEVWAEANGANIGRPHIARVMVNRGYVASVNEAFIRYLSNEELGKIESGYLDWQDVIAMIKESGGASVLAHPALLYTDDEVNEFIEAGIDGLECIHPSQNYTLQQKYAQMCEHHELLMTGGSDFHGGDRDTNKHFGTVNISTKYVDRMRRMTSQRKAIIK